MARVTTEVLPKEMENVNVSKIDKRGRARRRRLRLLRGAMLFDVFRTDRRNTQNKKVVERLLGC